MGNDVVTVRAKGSDDFLALMRAVDKKKPAQADVDKLRQYLGKNPDHNEALGNLARVIENAIVTSRFSSRTLAVGIEEYCEHQRSELGYYDQASRIERMLIDNLIVCWLRLYDAELRFESKASLSLAEGLYWERKLSSCQKRYLRAIETLAKVRRLLKDPPAPASPALAILMKQQVNVGR